MVVSVKVLPMVMISSRYSTMMRIAEPTWLEELVKDLEVNDDTGMSTCNLWTLIKSIWTAPATLYHLGFAVSAG